MKYPNPIIPASPVRQTTMVFHCSINCFKLITVPIWVMSRKIPVVPAKTNILESPMTSFGRMVQYPINNTTAVTKTEGIHAFVKVDTISPMT